MSVILYLRCNIFNMHCFVVFAAQNSNADARELNNSTIELPVMDKENAPPSPPASPLSTFSGLSPGVSPSGVSITSSFGDAEIDLDEINPSLPNNPISMVTGVNYLYLSCLLTHVWCFKFDSLCSCKG